MCCITLHPCVSDFSIAFAGVVNCVTPNSKVYKRVTI